MNQDVAETYADSPKLRRERYTVNSGETTPWILVSALGGAVGVKPGGGGTMRVELTASPKSVVLQDNADSGTRCIFEAWAAGNAAAMSTDEFQFATALRFVATGAAGVGEIAT